MLINDPKQAGEKYFHEMPEARLDLQVLPEQKHEGLHLTSECKNYRIRLIIVFNAHFNDAEKQQRFGFTVIAPACRQPTQAQDNDSGAG
ncbi:hypothetical protein S7S_04920 [Isoalcanivorax pacificus W11-5]|uniref:Uncharacterized protein n=1 Tax=Isoalcanivorax pacificus W11-5 TaxID=391936 RepID=A0A0B4XJZ7_9GAMM|nr:hypothetical protein [Isoalcanivorax pacificus]AJD47406.1 hypothetical protein S7S_04920 [Isoalcanivorax pacificus W11-5]